jgi:hypothetical protein
MKAARDRPAGSVVLSWGWGLQAPLTSAREEGTLAEAGLDELERRDRARVDLLLSGEV